MVWSIGKANVVLFSCLCLALGACGESGGGDDGQGVDIGGVTTPGATPAAGDAPGTPAGAAGSAAPTPAAAGTPTATPAGADAPDDTDDSPAAGDGDGDGAADDMMDDTTMEDDTPAVEREDLGEGDGSDVITIGDSYMNLNALSGTEISLESVSGRDYRNYAVAGTQILNGQIPGQYTSAKAENPDIKTVVMTGGGNDIILNIVNLLNCQGAATEAELSQECLDGLDEIETAVDALIDQMATDGVQDVVYIGYGFVTGNELGGTIEHAIRRQMETCLDDGLSSGIRCHFVDPSQELIGFIGADGIHPTNPGYDIVAEKVWARMQSEGVRR